jgi:hypothetical protein
MTNLLKEFPAQSFIGQYLRWARRRTDAPDLFHVGAALVALSSVFAPRVKMGVVTELSRNPEENRKLPLPPPSCSINLWVGFVGPASLRKTTAASLLPKVLLEPVLPWSDEDRKSVERSFEFFRAYPQGVIVDTWDDVVERMRRPSWSSGHGLLCELLDGTNMSRALVDRSTRGRYREPVVTTIKSPCLSALVTFRGPQKKLPDGVRMLMGRMLWLGGIDSSTASLPTGTRVRSTSKPAPRRTEPMLPKPDAKGADRVFCELARLRKWSMRRTGIGFRRAAGEMVDRWRRETPGANVHIAAALLRAAALDVLGRYAEGDFVEPADAERMIRVLGPAAIAGAARAMVVRHAVQRGSE